MPDMHFYINRQPEALARAIACREETAQPFARLWQGAKPDQLFLVGSGTSGNAARAAAPFLRKALGTRVTAVSPTSLPQPEGRPFFLFISQGGESTNTLDAIRRTEAFPRLALTGEAGCTVNQHCPHVVLTCGREAIGPKTMGYTSTVLTLYLMALGTAGPGTLSGTAAAAYMAGLGRMAETMGENIELCRQWVRDAEEELLTAAHWAVAGTGTGEAVAREAALKLMETLLRPATAFEFEEYLHGPTMMLSSAMGGLYLLPSASSPDRPRMEAMADLHRSFGSPVITVAAGERAARAGSALTLCAEEAPHLAPFWQILPAQLMAAALPAVLGIEGKGRAIFRQVNEAVGVKCRMA